ncbi:MULTISPECIES: hypothetical protein [Haloferacaceae]|uniref:Uncharacterized protein n=1 Tax=Halorubrum glutamatedens TaxID=2707018 RepID=A0ABD5QMI5_9EURY|nr:hypothetical protein [Halobellus captivus]
MDRTQNDSLNPESVIERYLDNEIEVETLETFLGFRAAESIQATATLLAEGEDLADDLAEL